MYPFLIYESLPCPDNWLLPSSKHTPSRKRSKHYRMFVLQLFRSKGFRSPLQRTIDVSSPSLTTGRYACASAIHTMVLRYMQMKNRVWYRLVFACSVHIARTGICELERVDDQQSVEREEGSAIFPLHYDDDIRQTYSQDSARELLHSVFTKCLFSRQDMPRAAAVRITSTIALFHKNREQNPHSPPLARKDGCVCLHWPWRSRPDIRQRFPGVASETGLCLLQCSHTGRAMVQNVEKG